MPEEYDSGRLKVTSRYVFSSSTSLIRFTPGNSLELKLLISGISSLLWDGVVCWA